MWRMDYRKAAFIVLLLLLIDGSLILVLLGYRTQRIAQRAALAEEMEREAEAAESVSQPVIRLTDIAEVKEREEETEQSASILLSSIQKDIKVMLADGEGRRKSGVSFKVRLQDESGVETYYEDEDKDGIISIAPLSSGKYTVTLLPVPEEGIWETKASVNVKEQISYRTIPILAQIKMESEINVALEDTADIEEFDEGVTSAIGKVGDFGIDVSKWNKEIDWSRVKNDGVSYAIIRLGYRGSSSGALVEDPYFAYNFSQAKANGIDRGVYFFTQAVTEAEAVEEASMVVALLNGEALSYPVFLDVEGSGGRADLLDADTRTKNILAFLRTIESAGYDAGVYANKNWFTNKIHTEELSGYAVWLAQYNVTEPDYAGNYHMWQYSSRGSIDGIEGNVDVNQSFLKK